MYPNAKERELAYSHKEFVLSTESLRKRQVVKEELEAAKSIISEQKRSRKEMAQ